MKFFRSYKKYQYGKRLKSRDQMMIAVLLFGFSIITAYNVLLIKKQPDPTLNANMSLSSQLLPIFFSPDGKTRIGKPAGNNKPGNQNGSTTTKPSDPSVLGIQTNRPIGLGAPASTPQAAQGIKHSNITTTFFWVGELSGPDNGNIPNAESTWDGSWQTHYGGVDDPAGRVGYLPGKFTPKENPFYFALPYSDFDDNGHRRASAGACANAGSPSLAHYSWCKNTWIAISHNGKVAYAQWEDAGPFGENDVAYVFGNAQPSNKINSQAGLDVSPAVKDYLGLGDVDKCDWWFISAGGVPGGPWKQIITTTLGDSF